MSTAEEVAALEAALKTARAKQAEDEQETPHTRLLADLGDDRVNPRALRDALGRLFDGFAALGVDLLAEGGPAKVSRAQAKAEAEAPPAGDKTDSKPEPGKGGK